MMIGDWKLNEIITNNKATRREQNVKKTKMPIKRPSIFHALQLNA